MLKWILAAVFIVLIWAAWFVFEEYFPWWLALILTVIVLGVLAGLVVWRRLRARRAAKELEKALAQQAAEQARSARPDLLAEIQEMQAEFQRAIGALKGSKIGGGGTNALYELPWYVIIGPPGSGKSTALRNSGLQFPYQSKSGGAVRGVGGTRNCDWWLTNEAVLLDTAGRWSVEEEDRDEWHAFLDLTKKFRPQKPLNGLLVAVAVSDLAGAHEDEVTATAKRIRERVDEVMSRLQMSLPVYVLFTKCDLIPGFVEFFGDLDRNSRGQIWGFTAPLAKPVGDPGAYFGERFDELAEALETRTLKRMSDERKIEARERIHEFPQQYSIIKKNLQDFVGQLFSANVFAETPQFRGSYFTSGTQEGRPIDRMMSRMAEAFGLQGRVRQPEATVDPKSYFLRDVFSNVVFRDKDIAVRSAAEVRRQLGRQLAIAASIFAIALLIIVLPGFTWWNSRTFLVQTDEIASRAASAADDASLDRLNDLRDRTQLLRENEVDGAPLSMRLGMYEGDEVYVPVRDLYISLLRSKLIQPIVSEDIEQMGEFGRRYEAFANARPTAEEHGRFYNVLKSHLLLSKPAEENQPSMSTDADDEEKAAELREWLTAQLKQRYLERARVSESSDDAKNMEEHTKFYVELVAEDQELLFQRDADTVQRTRNALNRVAGQELALNQIISQFERRGYDVTLATIIGGRTSLRAREDSRVRGAFTRRAWDESVRDQLMIPGAALLGEPWVLGRATTTETTEEDMDRLRSAYFRAYTDEWRQFITNTSAAAATISANGRTRDSTLRALNEETLRLLQELTSGDPSPHQALFQQVRYNTTLQVPQPEPTEAEQSATAGVTEVIERQITKRLPGPLRNPRLREAYDAMMNQWNAPPGPEGIPDTDPRYVSEQFKGFAPFGALPEGQGDAAPQPLALDHYLEQLRFVRDALQTYIDDPATSQELMDKLQTARTVVRGQIEDQEIGWRPDFERLLWPPIDSAASNSSAAVGQGAGRSWCAEVYTPWRDELMNRYPFNPAGHDVPLDSFTTFFKRGDGTLWGFYDAILDRDIERQGSTFSFSRRLGRDTNSVFQRSLANYLTNAHAVTESYFAPDSADPQVDFDVRIRPTPLVATIDLTIDEQIIPYENAPERWTRAHWPNKEAGNRGARLEIAGDAGMQDAINQEGEWGFLRLLEAGTVATRAAGVFTVVWRLHSNDIEITVDFRPTRTDTPFFGQGNARNAALMQPVRTAINPPREIVVGANTCRN
jgi:type VI secretion system protein ImpL